MPVTHHQEASRAMQLAFSAQIRGDFSAHNHWIDLLLTRYYDPMYDYQLRGRSERICFQGDENGVCDYAASLLDSACPR